MSDSRLLIPDGVKPEFVLDNTEKRSCTIFPEESGCHRYQIFRSEDLPEKEIPMKQHHPNIKLKQ